MKSPFNPGALHHVYQRADDLGVIFYRLQDRLAYYTLAATMARKYKIKVWAAAIMFTHIHQSCRASDYQSLWNYLRDLDSSFARAYNHEYGRKGKLFRRHPGIAPKSSEKAVRTNILYVINNHVEKQLCSRATDERWCFIAYAKSPSPFSDPFILGRDHLKRAIKLIDKRVTGMRPLKYRELNTIFKGLNEDEVNAITDYIIGKYSLVNHAAAIRPFGSFESLITAAESTTGAEHDFSEDYYSGSDVPFIELIDFASGKGYLKRIFQMDADHLLRLAKHAKTCSNARISHIERFFHIQISH